MMNGETPRVKTGKVKAAIRLLIVAAVCQFLVPAIAIAVAIARDTPLDEFGRLFMIILVTGETLCIACNITGVVLLNRGSGAGRLFGVMGLMGLLPLALLGIALGAGAVAMLFSREMEDYLGETYQERW